MIDADGTYTESDTDIHSDTDTESDGHTDTHTISISPSFTIIPTLRSYECQLLNQSNLKSNSN